MIDKILTKVRIHLKHAGYRRWARAGVALVFLTSVIIPAMSMIDTMKAYALDAPTEKVLGPVNKNLSDKFSFDQQNNRWQFNKDGAAVLAKNVANMQKDKQDGAQAAIASQLMAQQTGGSGKQDTSLYSVDLPVQAEQGITYYDNQTGLSFSMVPDFAARDAKLVQGRVVYPFGDGAKMVYTAKGNGLKEDIVLSKYLSDRLSYGYTLRLPDTLQATLQDDGSIGIFSANPALFGTSMSYGSQGDQAKVMDARKNAKKDHMLFAIPAPFIKDQRGQAGHTSYELNGNKLTVLASGLKGLSYPLTVDPSVVVSSAGDFGSGNDESMIGLGSSVSRSGITGGITGSWQYTDNGSLRGGTQNSGSGSANGLIEARTSHITASYNGYMYVLGGLSSGGSELASIERATINGNGSVGTWTASGSLPETRQSMAAFAYNGYLYVVGGSVGNNPSSDVKMAPINASTGALGTWTAVASLPQARNNMGVVAYNGMVYAMNGCTVSPSTSCNTASPTAAVYCANIYATGQLSAWSNCTSTNLVARDFFAATVYNGYIYGVGGCAAYNALFACTSQPTTVQYARINPDGSLGTWVTSTTSFSSPRAAINITALNGYLYLTGGFANSYTNVVQYAPLLGGGLVGSWQNSTSFTTARTGTSLLAARNKLYVIGGCANFGTNCSSLLNDVQVASPSAAGSLGTFTTSASTFTGNRRGHQTVVYNQRIYVLGGDAGGAPFSDIYSAPINIDGTVGAFSSSGMTAFTGARTYFGAFAYNGYMYVLGGCLTAYTSCTSAANATATVYKSAIGSDGSLSAWAAQTSMTAARYGMGVVVYNGYVYYIGGLNGTTFQTDIQSHAISANGDISGSWTAATYSLPSARAYFGAEVYGGYLYIAAGCSAGATTCSTPLNSTLSAPLSSNGNITANFTDAGGTGLVGVGMIGGMTSSNGTLIAQYANSVAHATIGGGTITAPNSKQDLSGSRIGSSIATFNGMVYVTGGFDGSTYYNTVQTAPINNGGGGGTTLWGSANGITTARWGQSSVAANGYVYVMGGCTSWNGSSCLAVANDYQYAPINGDGSLGSWTQVSNALASPVWNTTSVVSNGYVYVVGGCSAGACSNYLSSAQYAKLNSDGSTGTWSTTGTFSGGMAGRWGAAVAAYNGYIYTANGANAGGTLGDVWYAPLNGNGTIGTWTAATSNATARYGASLIAYRGYLYLISGNTGAGSSTMYASVEMASIGGSGAISGGWSRTTDIILPAGGINVSVANGIIYANGGAFSPTQATSATRYAPINNDGTIGNWTVMPGYITSIRSGTSGAMYNGIVYAIGGLNLGTGNVTNTVDYAFRTVQRRVGTYTKTVQVSGATAIANAYYNGTFDGESSLSYRVASSNGIYGSANAGTAGVGSEPATLCAPRTFYYVFLTLKLDDSQRVSFGTGAEAVSSVNNLSVYYRLNATPQPNQRMYGGKSFIGETQQALDICKQ